jgi:hypothetical protein
MQDAFVSGLSWFLLFVIGAAATGCGDSTGPGAGNPTAIKLQSDPGDLVGAGKSYSYTQATAIISVGAGGNHLAITVRGDEDWTGDFTVSSTMTQLEPGTYTAGSVWYGVLGCTTQTSSFTIDRVSYAGTTLTAIDLRFEQLCGGTNAALHGTIHWRADDPTHPPGPINPIPSSLWKPPPSATPGNNFVYFQSDPGDYIGQGASYLYTPLHSTIAEAAAGGALSVSVSGAQSWSGGVTTMTSLTKLERGYYSNIGRNPTKGALGWSVDSRACNSVSGWFAIDHVTYVADTLTTVDLRFEQHCDGNTSALHGAMHWGR